MANDETPVLTPEERDALTPREQAVWSAAFSKEMDTRDGRVLLLDEGTAAWHRALRHARNAMDAADAAVHVMRLVESIPE